MEYRLNSFLFGNSWIFLSHFTPSDSMELNLEFSAGLTTKESLGVRPLAFIMITSIQVVFQQVKERITSSNPPHPNLPSLGEGQGGYLLHSILHRLAKLLILPLDKRNDKTLHAELIPDAMQRTHMTHDRVYLPDTAEAQAHRSRRRVVRPT